MLLRAIAGLVALVMTIVLPWQAVQAASGSSTNAGKLASASKAGKRRAGGRVVRRKSSRRKSTRKATATSRRASKKRSRKSRKRIRRVLRTKRSGRKVSRKLRSKRKSAKRSVKRTAKRSTKRRARVGRKMVRVERGPVAPKLIKAAYSAIESGKMKSKAPFDCIPAELKAVLGQIAERWGTVTVNSSHRTVVHNRRVGGKSRSFHLKCQAADFSVAGSHKGLVRFLAKHKLVGGYKRYRAGHFHIDVGPKRTW